MEKIFVCGFDREQLEKITNMCELLQMMDPCELRKNSLDYQISSLIESCFASNNVEKIDDYLILFNDVEDVVISRFIDHYRETGLPRPLWAVVTKHSVQWSLRHLINELKKEREEIEKNS